MPDSYDVSDLVFKKKVEKERLDITGIADFYCPYKGYICINITPQYTPYTVYACIPYNF